MHILIDNLTEILTLLGFVVFIEIFITFYLKNRLDKTLFKKVKMVSRSISLWLFMVLIVKEHIFDSDLSDNWYYLVKATHIMFVIVVSITTYNILSFMITYHAPKKRLSSTRKGWDLILRISTFIFAIIFILKIVGVEERFGIVGMFGSIGVFLGLTSSVWFPSIKSGLVMLFSNSINEEDLIEVKELDIYGYVHRIGLFSTVIRNEIDNHQVVVQNQVLESAVINNLSKLSRVGGLREKLNFKIGYTHKNGPLSVDYVYEFFESAFKKAEVSKRAISVRFERGIEAYIENVGDHAIEFAVFYYTASTKTLVTDKYLLYEIFYRESVKFGLSLSTPITAEIDIRGSLQSG